MIYHKRTLLRKMKTDTKQIIGFTCEIITFVSTGYVLALHRYFLVSVFLALAFLSAIWTGRQIKEEALEESK